MRQGEPVASTTAALQTILKKINPAYEWHPAPQHTRSPTTKHDRALPAGETNVDVTGEKNGNAISSSSMTGGIPELGPPVFLNLEQHIQRDELDKRNGMLQNTIPFDFTQSNIGWDLDFATMDLEAFLSIHPDIGVQ